MMSQATEYEKITAFLEGATPADVLAIRPSDATRERVADLIHREKTDGLSPDETAELDRHMEIEHLVRLAKARAKKLLADR